MEIVHSLTMRLDQRRLVPCIDVVQCDANTRVLELTLLSGGEAWDVPSGMGVAVAFRKSDGTAGLYDVLPDGTKACSYSGNVVRAVLAPQVLTAWGKVEVAVVIQDGDTLDRVATFPVCLEVARDPSAGQGISNDHYRCTSLADVNGILDGFDEEIDEFRESVRPYAWTVNTAGLETNGWGSFLDLPVNRIYRLSYDLSASFGHPAPGKPGTLAVLDASGGDSAWGAVYIYLDEDGVQYIAYVKSGSALEDVRWDKVAVDMESYVAELMDARVDINRKAWADVGSHIRGIAQRILDACCDEEVVGGGENYNLLKVSEVEFSTRLQDGVEGTISSTSGNAVTGWIPVEYGKYYCMSVLYVDDDGNEFRTTQPGGKGTMYIRMNAKKADGTIVVYDSGTVPLASGVAASKNVLDIEYEDAVAIRLHFVVDPTTAKDISTAEKLKSYEPMLVEGDTAEEAYQNAVGLAYIDGDAEVAAEVEYTLKHDDTKADKTELEAVKETVAELQDASAGTTAELNDARTDMDGNTWSDVGSHIRGVTGKLLDTCCDKVVVGGGNYNLLKVSEVAFMTRLQDDVEGTVSSSTTNNAVTGWIPVEYGKYYCMSVLCDEVRTTYPGGSGSTYIRMNVQRSNGSIEVYNKNGVPLASGIAASKNVLDIEYEDAVAIRLHFVVDPTTTKDISTAEKLKAYKPMIVEGATAEEAYQNAMDLEYIDGDAEVAAEVEYTLKHDDTKADKTELEAVKETVLGRSASPYYRDVNFGVIPFSYYHGVAASYDDDGFGRDTTYPAFMEAWRDLVADHGGYVTETALGTASDGQMIYLYDFKPVRITNQNRNIPKIIIIAGQHGSEKSNIYGLFYFVRDLLGSWNQHPALEYLRNHVELMIVPVVNTYGFDHFTYKNKNGVNINRNYDSNWTLEEDTESDQYGGAGPFDQPESQIIRDLLLENSDASLVVDLHTNGSDSVSGYDDINYYGICEVTDSYYGRMVDAVAHNLSAISANFDLDYELGQPDTIMGYLNTNPGYGILRSWATDNDLVGVLVEGFNGFPGDTRFLGKAFKANEEIIVNWLITALYYLSKGGEVG